MGITVRVKTNRFPGAPAAMRRAIGMALADAGTLLLADMQRRTPVDTGELRGSETATVEGETTLRLTAGTDHAIYVHQGTRHMGARPFMRQAVEAGAPKIQQTIADMAARELAS